MWPLEGEHPLSCDVAVAPQRAELVIDIAVGYKLGGDLGHIWVVVVVDVVVDDALSARNVVAQRVVLEGQRWE
jgi:hypothetical protein